MSVIYRFLESLPLSMFQYDFMKNAFLAAVLIVPLYLVLYGIFPGIPQAFRLCVKGILKKPRHFCRTGGAS